jgi:hypothetical protein
VLRDYFGDRSWRASGCTFDEVAIVTNVVDDISTVPTDLPRDEPPGRGGAMMAVEREADRARVTGSRKIARDGRCHCG